MSVANAICSGAYPQLDYFRIAGVAYALLYWQLNYLVSATSAFVTIFDVRLINLNTGKVVKRKRFFPNKDGNLQELDILDKNGDGIPELIIVRVKEFPQSNTRSVFRTQEFAYGLPAFTHLWTSRAFFGTHVAKQLGATM